MKKIFSYLLVVLVAFSFWGCGKKRGGPLQITIWHQMQVEGREVLQAQLEKYMQANPEVTVTQLYKETEELRSSYQTAAVAGGGPQLIYGPSDQVGPFDAMGIIKPLENLFDQEFLKNFIPSGLVYFKGHLYQIADRVGNHLTLVYNKKLVPVPPKDTDELIRIGKKLTVDKDGDGKTDQWGLVWNYIEPYFFIPFLGGFGGWVMDEKGNPTLDTPATVEAFKFILDLRDKYKIIPTECDYAMADALFKEGRAGMIINGPWSWGGYEKAGIDYGLARIPKIKKTGLWPTPMVSPKGYSININTKGEALKESVKLIKYLTSPQVELEFTKVLNTIPSRKEANESPLVKGNKRVIHSREQMEVGRPMPVIPELRAIWDAMKPGYQAVLGGQLSPEKAAKEIQKEAIKKIKEMRE